jgi:prephenate dehydrogenase
MKIGIIGFSRFGQLLAKILKPYAEVSVFNRTDKSKLIEELGYESVSLKDACQCDWVIVAVAISATEDMIKKVAPLLKKGSLIMDVASVKVFPAKWLNSYISPDNQIMATHPMFGPDSAKEGTKGLQWILCPLRISDDNLNKVQEILNKIEVKIIKTTPDDHDKQTAISLALVHFVGRGLEEFGFVKQEISSLGFERLLKVNETVTNDSWQLFLDMQQFNPYTKETRKKLIKDFKAVNKKIK